MQNQEILDTNYLSKLKKQLMITAGILMLGFVLAMITGFLEESGVVEPSFSHIAKTGWVKLSISLAIGMFLMGMSGLAHVFLLTKLAWRSKNATIFANSVDEIPFLKLNPWMNMSSNWGMFRLGFPVFGIVMFSFMGFVGLQSALAFLFNW